MFAFTSKIGIRDTQGRTKMQTSLAISLCIDPYLDTGKNRILLELDKTGDNHARTVKQELDRTGRGSANPASTT